MQRLRFSGGDTPNRLAQVAKSEVRRLKMANKARYTEMKTAAKAEDEERQAWLGRVARQAEQMSDKVGGPCRLCHERDACMLVLRCGHVTACRDCWEAQGEHKQCAEGGEESKLALQIFRPLG